MDIGLDVSTLVVAVIAGIWTYWTWRAHRNDAAKAASADAKRIRDAEARERDRHERERERQQRHDELDEREYRNRDIAEAHAILKELTSREIFVAMQDASSEPNRSYLIELHRRMSTRAGVLYRPDGPNEGPAVGVEGFEAFVTMIYDRLDVIRAATKDPSPVEAGSRDFTKYSWAGTPAKHGKGGILSFIGARFTALNGITTAEEFTRRFGEVVRRVLHAEVAEKQFDEDLLLDRLLYEGQRDRYATANRRWRDTYGAEGVMTFDGVEYRTAWALGFKGPGTATLQKKLIEHFARDEDYPIKELERP